MAQKRSNTRPGPPERLLARSLLCSSEPGRCRCDPVWRRAGTPQHSRAPGPQRVPLGGFHRLDILYSNETKLRRSSRCPPVAQYLQPLRSRVGSAVHKLEPK
jgi:hypothetical protein